jgi:hypothetical protein
MASSVAHVATPADSRSTPDQELPPPRQLRRSRVPTS